MRKICEIGRTHCLFSLSLHCGSALLNGAHDVVISGATAEVAFDVFPDLLLRGIWVLAAQINGIHHHARCAKPALKPMTLFEGLLHGMEAAIGGGKPFDGGDGFALRLGQQNVARFHRTAVHHDRASTTLGGIAAHMGAGEPEIFANRVDQQRVIGGFYRDGLAVHRERCLHARGLLFGDHHHRHRPASLPIGITLTQGFDAPQNLWSKGGTGLFRKPGIR